VDHDLQAGGRSRLRDPPRRCGATRPRTALDTGHAKGKAIQKATALEGVGIPLHAGAEEILQEIGLIK
jgi:hypothetical protein